MRHYHYHDQFAAANAVLRGEEARRVSKSYVTTNMSVAADRHGAGPERPGHEHAPQRTGRHRQHLLVGRYPVRERRADGQLLLADARRAPIAASRRARAAANAGRRTTIRAAD